MQQRNLYITAVSWGILSGIIIILYSLFQYNSGYYGSMALASGSFVIVSIIILFAFLSFKRTENTPFSYTKGLKLGSFLSFISGLVSGFFHLIYMKYINPDLNFSPLISLYKQDLKGDGLTEDEITKTVKIMANWFTPSFQFIMIIVGSIIFGIVISLILNSFLVERDVQDN